MKNLKKVLSLVLALAMALSLMTAAFAADASDYKDYSKVTYKEAVDLHRFYFSRSEAFGADVPGCDAGVYDDLIHGLGLLS